MEREGERERERDPYICLTGLVCVNEGAVHGQVEEPLLPNYYIDAKREESLQNIIAVVYFNIELKQH